ncbi:MAG TPA: hypothetical protein VFK89_08410 [Actinomycetota bacterium]|nr:hypothetical protein [Actinomycetota bacterium]
MGGEVSARGDPGKSNYMERDLEDENRDKAPSEEGAETGGPVDGPGGDEQGQGATSQDEPG